MRKLNILLILILAGQWAIAQSPKWTEKAKRAVFSVVTYDKGDKILNTGNGFFVGENGTALSDYSLFKGAQKAIIITSEGKEMPVNFIIGANEMYDIIKFNVNTDKKVPILTIAPSVATKDEEVYLLPYSTKKDAAVTTGKVKDVSPIPGGYFYYTVDLPYSDKYVSCPITNADGHVIGLIQKSASQEENSTYAISAPFAMSLSLNALSVNDAALRNIGIKKSLPEKEDQALVYLYMSSATLQPEEYLELVNDFIIRFPENADGYLRRATLHVEQFKDEKHFVLADEDLKHALKVASKKDDVYFNTARLIYNNQLNKPGFQYKDWGYAKALEEIQKALAIDSLPLYIQQEGDIHFAMQNYAKAFDSYQKVNQSNLASANTFYSAAKTKELMGGVPDDVIALLDSAIAQFTVPLSENASPYIFERAQMKALNNQHREAIDDYNLYYGAVKGNVNDLFYYYRGQSSYQAKMFKQALEDIEKALELNPKDATYLAEQGAIYLRIARYDKAIKSLEEAIAIDPEFASCYRLIGFCQLQLGNKTEACKNFSKAKELGDEVVKSLIEQHCN